MTRRGLIGLGSAAAAAAFALDTAEEAPAAAPDPVAPSYRETDHIRAYYDRARG